MPRSTFSKGAGGTPRGRGSGIELSIEGQGLAALQRKLKHLPDRKELTRELNKKLRTGGKELIPDVRDAARDGLPTSGGLAARVAALPIVVQVKSGRDPGVVIKVRGHEAKATNSGTFRHPVFKTGAWVMQKIAPGWFSNRMKRESPKIRPKLLAVLEDIARKIARA